jgi:hypothetical protein
MIKNKTNNQKAKEIQNKIFPKITSINSADREAWWCYWRGTYNQALLDKIIQVKRINQ